MMCPSTSPISHIIWDRLFGLHMNINIILTTRFLALKYYSGLSVAVCTYSLCVLFLLLYAFFSLEQELLDFPRLLKLCIRKMKQKKERKFVSLL